MQEQKQAAASPSSRKGALLVFVAGVVLLTALALWRESGKGGGSGDDSLPHLARVNAGEPAAPFRAAALSGREISFPEDYRGKLVLIDFWATWCPPCVAELPHLRDAYDRFHERGFEILGVSLDASQGISAKRVRAFIKKNKISWETVYDGAGGIAGVYRVTTIPAPFLVDGDSGVVVAKGSRARGNALIETVKDELERKQRE